MVYRLSRAPVLFEPCSRTRRVVNERQQSNLLHSLPETVAHLQLVLGLPRLPDSLDDGYRHLNRVRVLNIADSAFLEELPEWLAQMTQLKHLYCNRCVKLKRLPRRLSDIYSKFKDIIIDLEGCSSLFQLETKEKKGRRRGHGGVENKDSAATFVTATAAENGGAGAPTQGGGSKNSAFLDVEQQQIVRKLLVCAEQTACTDLLTVRDGFGRRLEKDGCHIVL